MSESRESETLSDVVARRIVLFRKRRDMTRDQLAARCAELGYPALTSPALANIETGRRNAEGVRRREVSVDELMILAKALQVAPALLMFPIGNEESVPAFPGERLDTWTAFQWFAGEAYFGPDVASHWSVPIYLYRQHERWEAVLTSVMLGPPIDDDEQVRDRAIFELRNVRGEMQRSGLTPPVLPKDLEFVDERRHSYLTGVQVEAALARGETVRRLNHNDPSRSKEMKPGDGIRDDEALRRGIEFTEQWHRDHPDG